jgi:hypothetical protein
VLCVIASKVFRAGSPVLDDELALTDTVLDPIKCISMALEQFCLIMSLVNPAAAGFLVCIGFGGCGWLILLRVMQSGMDSCPLRNKAPTLASAADAMTLFSIWHMAVCQGLWWDQLVGCLRKSAIRRGFGLSGWRYMKCHCESIKSCRWHDSKLWHGEGLRYSSEVAQQLGQWLWCLVIVLQ